MSAGPSYVATGDVASGAIYRGFLTLSLSPLTSLSNVVIVSATLNTEQIYCTGNPFTATFGSAIEAWHVDYGPSLTTADCTTPNLLSLQYTLSTTTTLATRSVSVTSKVVDDWSNRVARGNRSQFLIRTSTLATDGDGVNDYCNQGTYNATTSSNRPYLSITYDYD